METKCPQKCPLLTCQRLIDQVEKTKLFRKIAIDLVDCIVKENEHRSFLLDDINRLERLIVNTSITITDYEDKKK